jgi:TfoX/Sxy family transcriptional regulator of competence genes
MIRMAGDPAVDQVQEQLLVHTNQLLGRTHHALAEAFLQLGDAHRAVYHARLALAVVTASYGEGALPVAHQCLLLQSALAADAAHDEAADVAKRAQHIFYIHFGRHS